MQQLETLLLPPLAQSSGPGSLLFFDRRCRALSLAELHWRQRRLVLATSAIFGLHPTKARELLGLCEFDIYIVASKWLWGAFLLAHDDSRDDIACAGGALSWRMLLLPEVGARSKDGSFMDRGTGVKDPVEQDESVDDRMEEAEELTCQICYGSFDPLAMVGGRESLKATGTGAGDSGGAGQGGGWAWTCAHPAPFCRSCYTRQLCTLVDQGASSALQACCPALGCTELLGAPVFEIILGGGGGEQDDETDQEVQRRQRGTKERGAKERKQSMVQRGERASKARNLQLLLERYRKFEAGDFVHRRRGARWCAGRGCGRAMLLLPAVQDTKRGATDAAEGGGGTERPAINASAKTVAVGFSRQARALTRVLEAGGPSSSANRGGGYNNIYKVNGSGFGYGFDVECSAQCPRFKANGREPHCFHCLQPPHAPATCAQAAAWVQRLDLIDEAGGVGAVSRAEDAAERRQQRWLLEHTKPCPGCSAAIERNRGCNHMACKGCGHEFCWVCLAQVVLKAGSTTSRQH
jgi:hypothetical protein